MNVPRLRAALTLAVALTAAACGGGDGDDDAARPAPDTGLVASVASYELEAGSKQRFLVGLSTAEQEFIGYGTADLVFTYAGTREQPLEKSSLRGRGQATYRLIPGQKASGNRSRARIISFDEGTGVYGVDTVTFPKAGLWELQASVVLDGRRRVATAAFEVLADSTIVEVGEPAPKTVNHLPGAAGVPPAGIDSRAKDANVPDPLLHAGTVADALGSGRPLTVVVSTPVYCVSRFCGPITDSVEALAEKYGSRMAFVHLEVWRDYEGKAVNAAAAEWILPKSGPAEGGREPWVFVVGADGIVTHRFDNVAADAELEAAVRDVLA